MDKVTLELPMFDCGLNDREGLLVVNVWDFDSKSGFEIRVNKRNIEQEVNLNNWILRHKGLPWPSEPILILL